MAKKRKQQTQQEDAPLGESILDHLAAMGRPVTGTTERTSQGQGLDTTALLAKIEALEQKLGQQAPQYPMLERTAPAQQATQQLPQVKVDLSGLPNPDEDWEGYNKGLQERINAAQQAAVHQVQTTVTAQFEQRTAIDRLWSGFREKYPEWAAYEPLVESVSRRVVSEAENRGVDLERYLFSTSDLFYGDLEKALKAGYGKLLEEGEEGEEEGDDQDTREPDGRTSGLDGPLGAVRHGKSKEPTKGPSMLDDLAKVQRSMGLY